MIKDFQVELLFEGQVHERYQFKLKINGNDYRGIFEEGEINWFNPQPETITVIESQVFNLMSEYLH